jgi:hypothetical protein
MDRRTERFLKQTRERELEKFDRRPLHWNHERIVDLGRLGKIPIMAGYYFEGMTIRLTDLSYYVDALHWPRWQDLAMGNHGSRIDSHAVGNIVRMDGDGLINFAVDNSMPPGLVVFRTPGYINYTFGVEIIEYVEEPIIWKEECGTHHGVERWLLRVETPQKVLGVDGRDVPYGDPDLEWL